MKCSVCKASKQRYYCALCLQDRAWQHSWLAGVAATAADSEHREHRKNSLCAADIGLLYEYQASRLRARHQRIASLRAKIAVREQQLKEAQQKRSAMTESIIRRRTYVQELKKDTGARLVDEVREAREAGEKKLALCQKVRKTLRKDRLILARAMCDIVGLQLTVPEDDILLGLNDTSRLFGLPWPGREDWAKYPNDYINACVGHSVHIFSVLTHYLHTDLPFHISKRGSSLYIRPRWREVDINEAALSITDQNIASFIVGLGMLFFDIAYMCHRQGVRVHLEQITDVVQNMRRVVLALGEKENEARQRVPFSLDIYSAVHSIMAMYVDGGREPETTLKHQVHDTLRRLHLCDDAVDSVDYEDENWALMAIVTDSEEVTYVPMAEQEEWKDVVPIPQEDGAHPICPIAYTDEYREMMDYFRAVMAKGEVSQRALQLSGKVIEENPGHYTVWVYRKKLVHGLNVSLEEELGWIAEIADMHPKCYQLWHHREAIVQSLLAPKELAGKTQDERVASQAIRRELQFLASAIDEDSKNFHAWSYRQWLVRTYGIWDQELAFIETMIDQDVRNNSAWNQRYFALLEDRPPSSVKLDDQVASREIMYAVEKIKLAPNNESPWSYIVGLLLRHAPEKLHTELLPQINALAGNAGYSEAMGTTPFYWSALVDVYEQQAKLVPSQRPEILGKARAICESLAGEYDPIRAKYWEFRKGQLH
ncbi:CAAX geranylgeranyltransferase alpha subunit [Dipsacomyces acuminosporus]|nr:CAAX geranylgeranyltransferase alpha subunit [Dipsacomyces acuminosporus]